ncbi:hypothetical protein [Pseudomonas ovata]|uniref:hypothetical protein n=1 Tax=Pseudomonas ovata TaxID=1839709 RepID=UPI000D6869CF|nr:hypothetical protein [Pseudomonas ovata]
MLKKLLIGALAILALVSAMVLVLAVFIFTSFTPDRTPTFSVPLDMQGPISTTRLEVQVTEPDRYAVTLRYPYTGGVERDKAWALAGGDTLKEGVWNERGSSLVFQVRIQEIPSEVEVLDLHVIHPKLNSWESNYLNAELIRTTLETGLYQVSVQREGSLADTPPAALEIQFSKAHRAK